MCDTMSINLADLWPQIKKQDRDVNLRLYSDLDHPPQSEEKK